MTIDQKLMTVAEFEAFIARPENDNQRFELVHKEIVEKMPTQVHAAIVAFLLIELGLYLRKNPIGRILPEARYQMPDQDENSRIPDLSFIRHESGPLVANGAAAYMPELGIEVQSPSQSITQMTEKAGYYLTNGSRMVWLIYPDKRLIDVMTANEQRSLTEADRLDGGDVLPGFSLAVASIFAEIDD